MALKKRTRVLQSVLKLSRVRGLPKGSPERKKAARIRKAQKEKGLPLTVRTKKKGLIVLRRK